jgi:hypothetical protein
MGVCLRTVRAMFSQTILVVALVVGVLMGLHR